MSKAYGSEPDPASRAPPSLNQKPRRPSRQNPLLLVQDHRQRWRSGERMSVEAYLERFRPAGVDDVELLDLIYNEVVLREEDGESPELEEYLDRFPGHDEALRAEFDVHLFLRTGGSFAVTLSTTSFDLKRRRQARWPRMAAFPAHSTTEPHAG